MMRRSVPIARLPDGWPGEGGLSPDDARERLRRFGSNAIVEAPPRAWRALVADTARDPMIWFLAGTSALYGLVGQGVEALTLLAAIAPLVGMDLVLHRRTQASTQGLQSRLASVARALREGRVAEVPVFDLVPGDLVLVGAGEPFPADGLVVASMEAQVDESVLTGEAYPVPKRPLRVPLSDEDEVYVDHEYWGFAGTRLLTGRASLRVVFTGGETLYGEIVRSAGGGARAATPLQAAIRRLVTILLGAAGALCLLIAVARWRQGHGWVDALVSAVTLATAALPEEFPVVFTFFLGIGVYRLARLRALVRRAVSVENIGRVSVVCADKTGTMTEGRLALTHLLPAPGLDDADLLRYAALASRPSSSDPLDAAVLRAAAGAAAGWTALATFPFTEGRRREGAVVRAPDGALLATTKGATETVLGMCTLAPDELAAWSDRSDALAAEGHKVIACARNPLETWTDGEPAEGYRFAGLLAFEDPVRDGVASAVARCREAAIHTIMVTGDHPLTALAVAREIGLGGGTPVVLAGDELETRVRRGEGASLGEVDVIARAAPAQKLALVRALQAAGEVVAVTGDGVNDVPALQAADVGIAMGERGTRSAREVAAIVLLDDNFRTIVRAIAEGRQLFQNLQLSFLYLLVIHIPLVVTAAAVPLAGFPLLYLPIHIVWLELVIHPTALLVFQELPASDQLARRAASGPARFFAGRDWLAIGLAGGLLTAVVVAGYLASVTEAGRAEHGRAMALAVLTLSSAVLAAALSGLRTWTACVVAASSAAFSVVLLQTPALARLLHVSPLHLGDWVLAALAALVACVPAVVIPPAGGDRQRAPGHPH